MARGRVFRPRTSTQRHRPSWSSGPFGTNLITASGSTLLGVGSQAVVDNLTLIRTRGIFRCFLSSVDQAVGGYTGSVGICNVSENAFNAGITAVPTPTTDIAWDGWLWHQIFSVKSVTATIGDAVNSEAIEFMVEIDSKAMRKTRLTDFIIAVIEVIEVGAASLNTRLDTRILDKDMS